MTPDKTNGCTKPIYCTEELAPLLSRIERLEAALRVYAESCDATETSPCGYAAEMCCKVARAALAEEVR